MYVFTPPPGWPETPRGWTPPKGWQPPPDWPDPPYGWSFWTWVDEPDAPGSASPLLDASRAPARSQFTKASRGRLGAAVGGVVAVAGLLVGLLAWLNPDPGSQLSTPEERRQYIAQVDALCVQTDNLGRQIPEPEDTEQYAQAVEKEAAAFQTLLSKWSALSFPRDTDKAELLPTLDALEAMVFSMNDIAESMRLGLLEQANQEYNRMMEHRLEFRRLARKYGFNQCPNLGASA